MANSSHKRDTNARPTPFLSRRNAIKIAAPIAAFATVAAVSVGVATSSPELKDVVANDQSFTASIDHGIPETTPQRKKPVSRSSSRRPKVEVKLDGATYAARAEAAQTRKAVAGADDKQWALEDLNLWDGPTEKAKNVGLLKKGKAVVATGRERNGRAEIVVEDESRWVTAEFLADKKPVAKKKTATDDAEAASGTGGSCTNGSSVPSGVAPGVVKVHQAVCARFPEISTYGTFRGDGEHSEGRAVDIMISGDAGWQVAEYVRANASALGVEYAIYSQKIWSVDRGGEGWRSMEDRGSATANHFDHVHVTVY
ncbi:hypothetical protein BJ980_003624 [Nocardioides daedukensis]|uniref:ARB-07466-like C-terminal domain-containing protein n=1 Tax=Nocardioides daedukensis TaxID=634462 RepID=A0A7Y9US99_9ACTN|nr:hypothetical protein [Nocardioides daedukensis]NYG60701.1 hypothetical protein [Nocardioides daedukensis]